MKHKSNSKSKSTGNRTQKNYNQGSNELKTFPSKPTSYGTKEQYNNPGNRVAHSSNENAWGRSRHSSVSDMWSDTDEHFPVLGASASSGPKVNVWEERKSKQQAIKALEPQNEYDEEAMLQHALTLSLLEATEEEQRRKKIEDSYQMQLEALQCFPEDFDTPVAFEMSKDSKMQDGFSTKKQLEYCSGNSTSSNSQTEKTNNYEDSKFQESILKEENNQFGDYSKNSIPNSSKKNKTYDSEGARPKVNKAIETFGGWGLKNDKRQNKTEKVSKFIDDVVNEKAFEKSDNKTYDNQKNKYSNMKENKNSAEENSWCSAKNSSESISSEKSDDKNENLYDEKGVFLDDDSIWNVTKNKAVEQSNVSPSQILDTWISSEDLNDWNDEISTKVPTLNDNNFIPPPSYSDKPKVEDNENISTSIEFSTPNITNDYELGIIKDSQTLSQKTSEPIKNVWSSTINNEDQQLPENKDAKEYDACDHNANNFTPFHEPTEVPTLTSSNIWSDKSTSNSSYLNSFSDNLSSQMESVKLNNDIDNEVFNITSSNLVSSNNDSDVPPIPPPQSPLFVPAVNEYSTSSTVTSDNDCKIESPPIPQSQPILGIPFPQLPAIGNPILNPMFPALNPILGGGMDPLMMRQMLILTNPFLANQLLAMEQYYRSIGMPVDLFSMATPMPNMSGMLNPSLLQNSFANNMNGNIQQLQTEIQQLQTQIDESATSVIKSSFENLEQNSFEKSHEPPRLDSVLNFDNSLASVENCNDDPWLKSFLSNDSASVIQPPKSPTIEVNFNNSVSAPQKSESSQVASSYDDKFAHSHASEKLALHSSNANKKKSLAAFEASSTKNEISGWSDPEDDYVDAQRLKSHTWDDGWGGTIPSPKPLRKPSIQEDRKKTVFRQPAKQPQIGRYQKNFPYS